MCLPEDINSFCHWLLNSKADLLQVEILDFNLNINSGLIFILFIIAIVLISNLYKSWSCYEVIEVKILDFTIKPNKDVHKIAHHAWAELITRKAGLEFDETHDVIIEVYDSWHELFQELRKLIKEIPSYKLKRDKNTRELVQTLQIILNDKLRPHLTEGQAKFRKWYEENKTSTLTPQEIQKKYPEYKLLVVDLKKVNKELVAYTKQLEQLAIGD